MIQAIQASKSQRLFERAKSVIPGGVNSPVRACQAVGADPVFIDRADGPYVFDVDGNRLIDYVGSWGPMILGHRHHRVLEALEEVLLRGTSFGAPCFAEVQIAELICGMLDSIEMVRMVNSGTEATMSAIRLARAFTKRRKILKFDGCYHGHGDAFLVKAGSGLATLGIASSAGVPEELIKLTISLPFNDIAAVERAFAEHQDIAAVITEPIVGNAGLILPQEGFLAKLKELCTANGALLIFDEVMTGFRVARGGAQEMFGIKPDLTTLGKIIGGGLPVGAYGGRKEIMEHIAPLGDVYQAGTLSGNPLAMVAGLAQLKSLQSSSTYVTLEQITTQLANGLEKLNSEKVPLKVAHAPGMITVFFTSEDVTDFATAQKCDLERFGALWRSLVKEGIYWPPSQFEAAFVSLVHSKKDIEETIGAFARSLKRIG